jgi:hypothetical protein
MSAQAPAQAPALKVSLSDYYRVGAILVAYSVGLAFITRIPPSGVPSPIRLIPPIASLAALTGVVWVLMVVVRNVTILRGITQAGYYVNYLDDPPPEWVERPARLFNNLFQAPVLFYLVCVLMMLTGRVDESQIALAWVYVATRVVHAIIYLGWNYVPFRFAAWNASTIALAVIWTRFAL